MQVATAHAQMGDMPAAERAYTAALPVVRKHGLRPVEGQLLANRALVRHYRGRLTFALADSMAADELYRAGDEWTNAAQNMANRAMTLFRLGRIPASLDAYLEAEELIARTSVNPATFARAKCETLMAAGLFRDALETAKQATNYHVASGERLDQIEAMALGSEAAFALGELQLAHHLAGETTRVKGAEAFAGMTARSELVALRCAAALGDSSPTAVDDALALAEKMRANGRPLSAVEAALEAARFALEHGDDARALDLLEQAKSACRRAPPAVQVHRWELVAEVRNRAGDERGVLRAVDAGLRAVERLHASVGSFEMRARASTHAIRLEMIAARVLLRRADARGLSALVTRRRAAALTQPAADSGDAGSGGASRDPLGGELALLLEAERAHRRDGTDASRHALAAAQRAVSDRSRASEAAASSVASASRSAQVGLARDESLLVFLVLDADVIRVHLQAGTSTIANCGSWDHLGTLIESQAYLARQLARSTRLSEVARQHLDAQYLSVSSDLAELLVPERLQNRVIISAPSTMAAIAWAALPGLWERPHCLAPSLAIARRTPTGRTPTAESRGVLVAGSDELPYVPDEVAAVATIWGQDPVINPGFSDVVSSAGSDLWHLAGHFGAQGDNPMFASVQLGGVHLHAHHVLGAALAPGQAVLSACNTAQGQLRGAGEVGFAQALLAAGTATVVVTSSLLEDGPATVQAMEALHAQLARGIPAADALANLRVDNGDLARSHLGVFNVLGAGWPRT